ncbi:hypothetical protein LTR84_013130 [Exophiala bonariae]|uniref:DUF4045 domain-containing protein n=1 Tax=Exophiala bonariae TaxID=1690606 RepID=A0AAV9NHJ7_9EURO|nr:hypothetical protein LTR84_013130 [Exophiala bonariae]
MEEDDKADDAAQDTPHKASRRDRFKGALARTKSKFKKHGDRTEEEHILSEDVDDFLAAGRPSVSSLNAATSFREDALPHHPPPTNSNSPRPSTSDSASFTPTKQSPRRLNVPRIDVSNSQRYPGAQNVDHSGPDNNSINDFLRPEYQNRSQSSSSLAKGKRRSRGLSVTFIEAPPVIIGIGGDAAPAPTVEISKARARARSVSPMRNQAQPNDPVYTPNRLPYQPPNGASGLPNHGPRPEPPDVLKPRALQRIQTGLSPSTPIGRSNLDQEFEMSLKLWGGSNNHSPASSTASPASPEILAPKPLRPVHPPPAVIEIPEPPELKKERSSGDLRQHFQEEENRFRKHQAGLTSEPSGEGNATPQSAVSSEASPHDQRPSRWR